VKPLVILLALGLAACASCSKKDTERADDAPGNAGGAVRSQPAMPRVHLTAADGTEHTVTVEVVREEAEVERGLMYRRHLDPDAGMLFLMGEEEQQVFWMKNTLIALDMIFIHDDFTVAGVVENAVPKTLDQRYVDDTSTYVLEVNGGWARAHGIGRGAKVRFENVKGIPSQSTGSPSK
jgi:uncharacterized membrane protein (UPF0127 family)